MNLESRATWGTDAISLDTSRASQQGAVTYAEALANSQQLTANSQPPKTNGRTDGLSPIGASGSYSDDLFETVA